MNVKNGFSTLNRLLGKKNKGTNLSKSVTNLNTTDSKILDSSSQLQQNRITPLPAATTNAPFEQTFRITVLLPKDQLYVARLGARVPLEKLMQLVCENKQLDSDKYEFRHPADACQVFSNELTIGSVGLTEIRLCHKSETYDNFNADEIIKLHRTNVRDSLSSSELSSRNSKHTLKTASPYSSSNSLNSIDSTGMNTSYRGPVSLPIQHAPKAVNQPPVAPMRKKRAAPRPPSQNASVITEKPKVTTNGVPEVIEFKTPLPKKEFHVSSPNLSATTELSVFRAPPEFHTSSLSIDCNGNNKSSQDHNTDVENSKNSLQLASNGVARHETTTNRPMSVYIDSDESTNLSSNRHTFCSVQNLSTSSEMKKMPEPSPRRRLILAKKKAPAPPPRVLQLPTAHPRTTATSVVTSNLEDTPEEPLYAEPWSLRESKDDQNRKIEEQRETTQDINKPEVATEKTSQTSQGDSAEKLVVTSEAVHEAEDTNEEDKTSPNSSSHLNVSKTVLNCTPTPDSHEQDISETALDATNHSRFSETFDNESKNADSGIGEPIQTPSPDSLQSSDMPSECKSSCESSSDEDEQINVYNLKLGKTIVKPLSDHKAYEDLPVISTHSDKSKAVDEVDRMDTISVKSETASWNFTIPAPPNFADKETTQKLENSPQDAPITPIIKKRETLDFQSLSIEQELAVPEAKDTNEVEKDTNDVDKETNEVEAEPSSVENDVISKVVEKFTLLEHEMNPRKTEAEVIEEKQTETEQVGEQNQEIVDDFVFVPAPSSVERFDSIKSDVVEELNVILRENALNTVIRKSGVDETTEIAAVRPSGLENFSIQKYEQTNGNVPTSNGEKTDESHSDVQRKEDVEDEKIYRKRSNITVAKHRRSVTRADSFHSTQNQALAVDNSFGTRSSSYLSLQKLDQNSNLNGKFADTNGRKSSSELSIGESPSLQSLIVMKEILSSRKNSENSEETKSTNSNELAQQPGDFDPCDIDTNAKVNAPKSNILSQDLVRMERSQTVVDSNKTDEGKEDKKWRYSGPPSINFSTWSERPKVQVAIMNEGDYIFGGSSIKSGTNYSAPVNSLPRSYRHSSVSTFAEFKPPQTNEATKPIVRGVEYKKSKSVALPAGNEESGTRTFVTGGTFTLSRTAKPSPETSNKVFAPTVRGFSQPASLGKREEVSLDRSNSRNSAQFVRLSSTNRSEKQTRAPSSETAAPFSQMTLRKTGLKEKILGNNETKKAASPPPPTSPKPQIALKSTLPERANSEQKTPSPPSRCPPTPPSSCPPPPPPVILGVVTKQNVNNGKAPSVDPRNALLLAIQDFKKDSLKKI